MNQNSALQPGIGPPLTSRRLNRGKSVYNLQGTVQMKKLSSLMYAP